MRRALLRTALVFWVLPILVLAAVPAFQTGRIIEVEKKTRSRVLYYLVNTPVTAEDPYYEVHIEIKDTVYLAEYEPRHADDSPPSEWEPGASVQVIVDKRHLIAKTLSGTDVTLLIKKRMQPEQSSPTKKE